MKSVTDYHGKPNGRKPSTVRIGTVGVPSRHEANTLLRHSAATTQPHVTVPASVVESLPTDPKAESASVRDVAERTNKSSLGMGLKISGNFPLHHADEMPLPEVKGSAPVEVEDIVEVG